MLSAPMPTRIHIGHRDDFPPGEIHAVEVNAIDEHDLAVCVVDGSLRAFADECTHMKWPLSKGHLADGLVYCSLHLACFDPCTGANEGDPATEPVQTYSVVEEEGEVFLLLPDASDASASVEENGESMATAVSSRDASSSSTPNAS